MMKRLLLLLALMCGLTFAFIGCEEAAPAPDTEIGGGDEGNGDGNEDGSGDAGEDGGKEDDDIPEGFVDDPDDLAADPVVTFDYSVLAKAGHPRLVIDNEGFKSLKEKVTSGRFKN